MSENVKSNKFMDWLQYKFTPAVQKFMTKPWITGFSEGVIKCLPFILTGALIFFYEAIASWVTFLPTITFVRETPQLSGRRRSDGDLCQCFGGQRGDE